MTTQKKSTSFRLSLEAAEQLFQLAVRFDKSQTEVIEFLIEDRYSSSDRQKNIERRDKAFRKFAEFNFSPHPFEQRIAFMVGYSHGWLDFQRRHKDNDFIIEL